MKLRLVKLKPWTIVHRRGRMARVHGASRADISFMQELYACGELAPHYPVPAVPVHVQIGKHYVFLSEYGGDWPIYVLTKR